MKQTRDAFRGVTAQDSISSRKLNASHSGAWDSFLKALDRPTIYLSLSLINLLTIYTSATFWELALVLQWGLLLLVLLAHRRNSQLPFRIPKNARQKYDPNHPLPGEGNKLGPPTGDMFLGVERISNKQVWFQFNDWLRHGLVTGSTGSGKTELLISIAYNFLCAGGNGFMFTDPKGDHKTITKLMTIAKRFGREDDVFVCNYDQPENRNAAVLPITNTCNPLQYGSAAEVANMVLALLPANDGGANAVFAENAITLAQSLSRCLVELRDATGMSLSWKVFRRYLTLEQCLLLALNDELSAPTREELALFLYGLAGVDRAKAAHNQSQTAIDQFGYVASYLQRGLASLTGTFGQIYDCENGDFSYRDIVQRKRILLSVMPSLKNSSQEIRQIGRIDLLGKKQALAESLGMLHNRSNAKKAEHNAGVPSLNIMDEYKYISVPGMSIVATQGRSLGWASVVGVQSYAGLAIDGADEADEWVENTSIKFVGSAQGDSTFAKFNNLVGRERVARLQTPHQPNNLKGTHPDARFEWESVLNIKDIRAQIEGEFTLLVRDKEIRMRAVFIPEFSTQEHDEANLQVRINTFIDLPRLTEAQRVEGLRRNQLFASLFSGELNLDA